MSMGSRKVNTEGIDEELLIASIGRRKQDGTLYRAQEPPVPAPEEELSLIHISEPTRRS